MYVESSNAQEVLSRSSWPFLGHWQKVKGHFREFSMEDLYHRARFTFPGQAPRSASCRYLHCQTSEWRPLLVCRILALSL